MDTKWTEHECGWGKNWQLPLLYLLGLTGATVCLSATGDITILVVFTPLLQRHPHPVQHSVHMMQCAFFSKFSNLIKKTNVESWPKWSKLWSPGPVENVLAGASVWINLHYLYPDVVNQHLFILATMQTCRDWWCEHYLFMLATIQTCRDWWGEHLQLIVSNDIPARLSIILNNCFPNHICIQLYDRRKRHLKEKEREKWA